MFGYVRPDASELKGKEYQLYRSVYCGICQSMRKKTGCTSCLALSYDSVLLSLCRMTVSEEHYTFADRNCILHPFRKRKILNACEATEYAAQMQATLAYHHVRDDLRDCRGTHRWKAQLLRPFVSHWYRKAKVDAALGDAVADAMERQRRLEQENCDSPDCAAEPTGQMLAAVFSHGVQDASAKRVLWEFGTHIGKCVYFLDAADDFEKDKKQKNYNPFLCAGVTPKQNAALRDAVRLELMAAANAFSLLGMRDQGIHAIVENILYEGLPHTLDRVLAFASEQTEPQIAGVQTKERLESTND